MAQTAGGVLFRISGTHTGVELVRALVGVNYQISDNYSLYFSYFVGAENRITNYTFIGRPLIQFIFRLDKSSKYIPAEYMNF